MTEPAGDDRASRGSTERFDSPLGGAVAVGRQRLRRGLGWLAALALAVAVAAAWVGRAVPALLAGAAAALTLYARRMSADLDPLFLTLDGRDLIVQMLRRRERFPLSGSRARRLEPDEIEHLTRLATTAGVTAGTGGFDSHRLGELDLYATDLGRAVLIDLGERSVVVTPDDPDRFLALLASRAAEGRAPADPEAGLRPAPLGEA